MYTRYHTRPNRVFIIHVEVFGKDNSCNDWGDFEVNAPDSTTAIGHAYSLISNSFELFSFDHCHFHNV